MKLRPQFLAGIVSLATVGSMLLCSVFSQETASPQADPEELPRIPPTEPEDALGTFEIKPGYRLELAACEPQVVDPIALAWDAKERLFVVEMRGYSERRDDSLGRIRLLEDRDGDGFYETSHVYAEDLQWPTGLLCYNGGVFVIATPDLLYFEDTNGDGKADHREVVFTGFGEGQERLNVQALANSLTWGVDGRIHGATAMNGAHLRRPGEEDALVLRGRDFSFSPATREVRAETGGGQYGLTFDDWGNKFVCSNSHHMQWIAYDQGVPGLPPALVDIPADGAAAEVFRLSPDEPWRLVRTRWRVAGEVSGPVEGGGRVSGYFTAATGICSYHGDLFTADAGSNLVHRKILAWEERVQPVARRPDDESQREFLASRDNWFRPVYLSHGPDGELFIADMYREVIEHPWSLPEGIKKHLDLNSGNDRGRIYRILPENTERPRPLDLTTLSDDALVGHLKDPIAWRRLTAARLLQERRSSETPKALRRLFKSSQRPETRLLALHGLAQHESLKADDLTLAFQDPEPWIRAAGIRLVSEQHSDLLQKHIAELVGDPSPNVRFSALLELSQLTLPLERLAELSTIPQKDSWCQAALQSVIGKRASALVQSLLATDRQVSAELVTLAGRTGPSATLYRSLPENLKKTYRHAVAEGGHRFDDLLTEEEIRQLLETHTAIARDEQQPEAQRLQAVDVLGALDTPEAITVLTELLFDTTDEAVVRRSLELLGRSEGFDHETNLLDHWTHWSPALQSFIIDLCLTKDASIIALLDRVEEGVIRRSSLSGGHVTRLQNHGQSEIRRRARALLVAKTKAEREAAVVAARPALELEGRPEAGRIHYEQRCASCHEPRSENNEKTLGPTRQALAQNGKERLLINLIDPNREVLPNYFASVVTRKDGTALSGIISTESRTSVTVRLPLGEETEVARDDIASILTEQHSAMPEGLEAGLSAQDLADLLSYLTLERD